MGTLAAPLLSSQPKIALTASLTLGICIMPPTKMMSLGVQIDAEEVKKKKKEKKRLIRASSGHQHADA